MPRTYKTVDGDMYDLISFKVYGTEYHRDILNEANPAFYDARRFEDGDILIVPDLPANFAEPNPPWIGASAR